MYSAISVFELGILPSPFLLVHITYLATFNFENVCFTLWNGCFYLCLSLFVHHVYALLTEAGSGCLIRSVVLDGCEPPVGLGFEPRHSGRAAKALNHRFIYIRYFYVEQAGLNLQHSCLCLTYPGITCTYHHTGNVQRLKPRQVLFHLGILQTLVVVPKLSFWYMGICDFDVILGVGRGLVLVFNIGVTLDLCHLLYNYFITTGFCHLWLLMSLWVCKFFSHGFWL